MDTSNHTEYENEEMGLQISIELMARSLEKQGSGIDSMRATARTLLGASSVIVSLLGALQLIDIRPQPEYLVLFYLGIGFSIIVYAVQMFLSIQVLSPLKISGPIKEDWDLLYEAFTQKSKIDIMRNQLVSYLDAIEANIPIMEKIHNKTKIAGFLLALVVIVLLLLSFIPRQTIC